MALYYEMKYVKNGTHFSNQFINLDFSVADKMTNVLIYRFLSNS